MRITGIKTFVVRIPLEDPFGGKGFSTESGSADLRYAVQPGWRGIYSRQTETTLVRIETDEGIVGFGEGQAPVGPEVTAAVIARILRPILLGRDPMQTAVLYHEMYESMNIRGHYGGFMVHAIAAIDIALWDIKGKKLELPVADLLGGAFRQRVPAYVSGIRGETIEDKLATVQEFLKRDFHYLKVFLGFGLDKDCEYVRELTKALGKEGRLMVDVLWNYDVPTAIRLGRFLESSRVIWFEAPTSPEDVAGHAEIARTLDIPIAAGETEVSGYQFLRWFQDRALDIAQPDVARCGITESRRIADLAHTFNVRVALHAGIGLAPAIAASLHVAAAIQNLIAMEYQPVMLEMTNRFLKQPIMCEKGMFRVPAGPGLGIEIDEDALSHYAKEYE